jgi:hypothetical protein
VLNSGGVSAKNRRSSAEPKPQAALVPNPVTTKILSFLERRSLVLSIALVLFASLRIVATYTVFNHTSDEPAHIACGMEWLDKGIYVWEPQHPPLARVATALGPYLAGARGHDTPRNIFQAMWKDGLSILYQGHHYDQTLALARLGILPFFWLACAVVYWWGRRFFGSVIAAAAVFLFSFLPPILAHAGLATTDMALTATMGAAFLAGLIWLERPTPLHALGFGAAAGLMVLSKFSAFVFFPASVALAFAWYAWRERPRWRWLGSAAVERLPSFALAVAVSLMVIWAGYRFSFGDSGLFHLRLPAPELFAGIRQVQEHNAYGHDSYLLGTRGTTGFWLFFPIALAVKTPLAFLLLLGFGAALLFRHPESGRLLAPFTYAAGILLIALFSRIDIGVRHILPLYAGLSLVAAAGLVRMLELAGGRPWVRAALGISLLWFAGASLLSHPDYLPYFNELAGSEPEKILADSDLDWGQDLKRLSARLREVGATDVAFDKYINGEWEKEHGFPRIHRLNQMAPTVGWNAIGVGLWKESRLVLWPDWTKPQERVGKSILLWYFPPPSSTTPGSPTPGSPPR